MLLPRAFLSVFFGLGLLGSEDTPALQSSCAGNARIHSVWCCRQVCGATSCMSALIWTQLVRVFSLVLYPQVTGSEVSDRILDCFFFFFRLLMCQLFSKVYPLLDRNSKPQGFPEEKLMHSVREVSHFSLRPCKHFTTNNILSPQQKMNNTPKHSPSLKCA